MTAGKTPFFSILVPTRDRPEYVRYNLESLKRQTFTDFEVVVCDNHSSRPCKSIFQSIADERFRYLAPPSSLSMADNWELASQHARGEYVGVLIDKTVLMPSALEAAHSSASKDRAEIICWWNEQYDLLNETQGHDRGAYTPASIPCLPARFDPFAELQRRFLLDVRRGNEGKHYYWGKICFGVYHRSLIARIKERIGRLFHPLIPDYTSMVAALGLTESAIDLGRPLLLSFSSKLSTGAAVAHDPAVAKKFFTQLGPDEVEQFPLPGVYASHHNGVASEYLKIQRLVGGRLNGLELNRENLVFRVMEDLEEQKWNDERERLEQQGILAGYLKTIPIGVLAGYRSTQLIQDVRRLKPSFQLLPAVRRLLLPLARRFPVLKRIAKALRPELNQRTREQQKQYTWEHRDYFSNIVEAAEAADTYYRRRLADNVRAEPYV